MFLKHTLNKKVLFASYQASESGTTPFTISMVLRRLGWSLSSKKDYDRVRLALEYRCQLEHDVKRHRLPGGVNSTEKEGGFVFYSLHGSVVKWIQENLDEFKQIMEEVR
jgi:hypothetical protein